jgi:hypothetical protein
MEVIPPMVGAVLWNRFRLRGSCESAALLNSSAAALSQLNLLQASTEAAMDDVNDQLIEFSRLKLQFLWRVGLL